MRRILVLFACCLALAQTAAAQSGPFTLRCRVIGSSDSAQPIGQTMSFAVNLADSTWCENCSTAPRNYQTRGMLSAVCNGCPEHPTIVLAREDDRGRADASFDLPTGRGQYARVTTSGLTAHQVELADCRPR